MQMENITIFHVEHKLGQLDVYQKRLFYMKPNNNDTNININKNIYLYIESYVDKINISNK